ncbi:MAG: hypothetical protein [Bacteriophage sp.]|nr:MAG: hypothetical protein [Bacteriophage sp.]
MNEATEYFKKYGIEQAKKAHAMSINLGHEDLELKKLIEDSKGKIDKIDLEKEIHNFEYFCNDFGYVNLEKDKTYRYRNRQTQIIWTYWKARAKLSQSEVNKEREQATEYYTDCEYLKAEINYLKQKLARYENPVEERSLLDTEDILLLNDL